METGLGPLRIADVVHLGDRRKSLEAIRDRLAAELEDTKWATHKRECACHCGMADIRAMIAAAKQLVDVIRELSGLPEQADGVSDLDQLADELTPRRSQRRTATSGL